jgi:hypothetical protein
MRVGERRRKFTPLKRTVFAEHNRYRCNGGKLFLWGTVFILLLTYP